MKNAEPSKPAKSRAKKIILWGVSFLLVMLVLGVVGYLRLFRSYPPKELIQDIRAGIVARDTQDPDKRFEIYLEHRYGSMAEAANRQKAFLAFFDPEHIRALQFLATHAPKDQQAANIAATARWVEQYRNQLTPAERAALGAQINSDAGRQMLRNATATYNSQDIYYRGKTVPVIEQLLKTIHDLPGANK
ncbi:MAG: hypothetical protein QM813_09105 [Verrucomicrobiota bacterium]